MDPESTCEVSEASPKDEMTVGEALDEISANGNGRWAIRVILALSVNVCVNSLEVDVGVYIASCVRNYFEVTVADVATLTAANGMGQLIGSFLLSSLADIYGRRQTLIWLNVGVVIFAVLQACAPSLWIMIFCRVAIGICEGPFIVGLDYIVEVAPTGNRGRITTIVTTCAWGLGSFGINLMAWAVVPTYGLKTLLALMAIPFALTLWMLLTILVESPRWLISKGRTQEAFEALAFIAESNGTSMPCRSLVSQADESTPLHDHDKDGGGHSFASLLQQMYEEYEMLVEKTGWYKLLLLSGSYIGLGFTYAATVLFQGDIQALKPALGPCMFDYHFTSITSASEMFGGVMTVPFIDRPDIIIGGRKGTQAFGYSIAAAGMILGGYNVSPSVLIACIARGTCSGANGVTLMQGPEVLEASVRGTGSGYLNALQLLGCLLAPYWVFAPISSKLNAFGIAAGMIFTIVCGSLLPETALVEMDAHESPETEVYSSSKKFADIDQGGNAASLLDRQVVGA